ncbi:WSC domain-containing protein [Colletotrichum graminicola]|uniref:WSC domain-containing protein n=1 Tax=Colletotrichum graminicola (strain M1.001 / M2 / FGSC 10212) TaxID=645133 RepID=E3QAZ3_COLGM|nr:WSC domain-containing protein [Colletotrichum graminicola M1.001]EFQ28031.1 WSC domain-containing protein [Colletotrichum graminicola M1.001]WDK12009.1 WSC domain-containing protein [Colletotrichum graminicola]
MKVVSSLLLGLLGLACQVHADPTWPSDVDELEEIMYQMFNARSRKFADAVFPCNKETNGAGRQTAAEWLRTAFHDMAPANVAGAGTGGLDASIQYELSVGGENAGPGFATSMTFFKPYLTRKSSMSDLIALGVYASVLSCNGPSINYRSGRIDATVKGPTGVPQPGNAIQIFTQQFGRMGFTPQEMVQVTACGHTIGGVHSAENPNIVPAGTFANGMAPMDTTNGVFDNKVVTEYLDGTTKNPLVFTMGNGRNQNSDFKVFNSDNATMRAMADNAAFKSACKTVFEKMVNVVPSGVTLTDPIKPYTVKPVDLQLSLASPSTIQLQGAIRIRTTEIPLGTIASLTINYKTRDGSSTCGSSSCAFTLSVLGISRGLEDNFAWYPISQTFPVSTGISSFTVTINKKDGSSTLFNNNGNGYPLQDAIFLQPLQSCLQQSAGDVTFVVAVRNDRASLPVKVEISYKTTRTNSIVPLLNKMTVDMVKGSCQGSYTFFTVTTNIPGGLSPQSTMDFISGEGASAMVDSFKKANPIGGTCQAWSGGSTTCNSVTASAVPTSTTVSASGTSSTAPTATLHHRETMGGYKLVSCWTEASGGRALTGAAFAYDGMTLDSCMANCTGFDYWGTEYGRECYCGNSLAPSTTSAPLTDCSMQCSGDSTQYCGAGDRIELYSTTATRSTSSTAAPTATLAHINAIGKYSLVGCQTEADGGRALQAAQTASDDMTLDKCAAFCSDYTFFGTEYGRECYCGNELQSTSKTAPLTECNMKCASNPYQYCGDGNRLELYKVSSSSPTLATITSSVTSSAAFTGAVSSSQAEPSVTSDPSSPQTSSDPATSSSPASSSSSVVSATSTSSSTSTVPTLAHKPTISPFALVGCWTEGNGVRALGQKNYASGDNMTLEYCASFCSDYKYFGTEYGSECYCGDFLAASSSEAPLADCAMTCSGNQYEYCGAGNRLTLYQTDKQVGEPAQPATVGAYTFLGCRTEPAQGGRALDAKGTASDKMTNEACAAFCDGYTYFGTEYGAECYCGNALPETSLEAPASDCSMFCTGSDIEYCGNGNRLSVYQK